MTQPRRPKPVRQARQVRHQAPPEKLDPLLNDEESALLHLPPALMGVGWQAAQACDDPECLACRIGRAVAWMTKGHHDILTALKVLNDLVEEVGEDPHLGPAYQEDLAAVSLHELDRVCEGVEYWTKNLGYACGLRPLDGDEGTLGVTLHRADDGALVAQVVRKEGQDGGAGAGGRAN